MNSFDPSEGSESIEDLLREIQLGDALGSDTNLLSNLIKIDETIREDAPVEGHWIVDLLCMAKAFLPASGRFVANVYHAAVRRFTDIEIRRIKAEADSHRTMVMADANAELVRAQARKFDAEAVVTESQGTAVADEERAKTRRKDELLQAIVAKRIKLISEHDPDREILRTLFTKAQGPRSLEGPTQSER